MTDVTCALLNHRINNLSRLDTKGDYATWAAHAEVHLETVEVWEIVTGTEEKSSIDRYNNWKQKNKYMKSLLEMIDDDFAFLISNKDTSKAGWKAVEDNNSRPCKTHFTHYLPGHLAWGSAPSRAYETEPEDPPATPLPTTPLPPASDPEVTAQPEKAEMKTTPEVTLDIAEKAKKKKQIDKNSKNQEEQKEQQKDLVATPFNDVKMTG
ncbi:hypothetical protein BDZ91DRAFT_802138 [Kalaharituber pfeilii]|nr:hypothetical protein BDZ91DRAFT_802138 [Kalaharituber pfeilii]